MYQYDLASIRLVFTMPFHVHPVTERLEIKRRHISKLNRCLSFNSVRLPGDVLLVKPLMCATDMTAA